MEPSACLKAQVSPDPDDRIEFLKFLRNLTWARGSFTVMPGGAHDSVGGRRDRPGFIVHSLLGPSLKELECGMEPKCQTLCAHPSVCVCGRLLLATARGTGSPLPKGKRVQSGLI